MDDVESKRQSLKITPPHTFKQKVSSLLTPVSSLKESFHKKRRSWMEDKEEMTTHPYELTESESLQSLSDTSILTPPNTPSMISFNKEEVNLCDTSLGYQVKEALGKAMMEADEEIDQDWEISRERLEEELKKTITFTITL